MQLLTHQALPLSSRCCGCGSSAAAAATGPPAAGGPRRYYRRVIDARGPGWRRCRAAAPSGPSSSSAGLPVLPLPPPPAPSAAVRRLRHGLATESVPRTAAAAARAAAVADGPPRSRARLRRTAAAREGRLHRSLAPRGCAGQGMAWHAAPRRRSRGGWVARQAAPHSARLSIIVSFF